MKPVSMAIALGMAVAALAPVARAQPGTPPAVPAAAAMPAAPHLYANLRALWQSHIVATRDYVLARHTGDQAEEKKALNAETKSSREIADTLAGFYGKAAGANLLKLLGGHVKSVNELANAAHAKDQTAEFEAMGALTRNATEIAQFLAGANPGNWTADGLNQALQIHVADHRRQIDQIMGNAPRSEQDKSWAEMQHHMRMIADVLADGISRQFPEKVD